jgi:hypothetical protein
MNGALIQLLEQITSYTVFEENQVLTSGQLNRLTGYLERQHRLTRTKLLGVGIVCGLEVGQSGGAVTVTRGCGVTTDGDLLYADEDGVFTHFKPFKDENAGYPFFIRGRTLVPLLELLPQGTLDPEARPLGELDDLAGKVALLYLESYRLSPDICTGGDCDSKGKEQRQHQKVLLLARSDLEALSASLPSLPAYYFDLPEAPAPRALLPAEAVGTVNQLAEPYFKVIQATAKTLLPALEKSYQVCEPLLRGAYHGSNPTTAWLNRLAEIIRTAGANKRGIQYVYDFFNDLLTAYAEFKEALFGDPHLCCPEVRLFPKHLVLGAPVLPEDLPKDPLRHGFYPSPALRRGLERQDRVVFLHQRLDYLLRTFQVPEGRLAVRLTPSRLEAGELGERAIPYYYRVDANFPLHRRWHYEKHRRRQDEGVYGYFADKYNGLPQALEPLKYNISRFRFFRIEGHLGEPVDKIEAELKQLIRQFNLPIKVMTLQIEADITKIPVKPPFLTRDLKALHYLFRKDIRTHLDNLSAFNLQVKKTIQKGVQANTLPPKDVRGTTMSYQIFTDESPAAPPNALENKLKAIRSNLAGDFGAFDTKKFKGDYQDAVGLAANINRNVKGVTFASAYTPYETLVNESRFKWLEWLSELIRRREDRGKELSIFGRFLQEHPGAEHLGGVERGGTFILVYSSGDNRVVADFALPYRCVEALPEEEPEPAEEVDTGGKWVDFNDILVHLDKGYELEGRLDKFELNLKDKIDREILGKMQLLELKFNTQKEIIDKYSLSLDRYIQNTQIGRDLTIKPVKEKFADRELAQQAEALESLGELIGILDLKIAEGRATREETATRKSLDDMVGQLTKGYLSQLVKTAGDIQPGSEPEKFIRLAGEKSALIKDDTVKADLKRSMVTLNQSVTREKPVLAGALRGSFGL